MKSALAVDGLEARAAAPGLDVSAFSRFNTATAHCKELAWTLS